MSTTHCSFRTMLAFPLLLAGCRDASPGGPKSQGVKEHGAINETIPDEEDEIKMNLAKLGPEDRRLAEEQTFCVIQDENRLGSMGAPVKVMVKDQPVFLCCGGCKKKALADPDSTLAKVQKLKSSRVSPMK